MKRTIFVLTFFLLALTACSPQTSTPIPTPLPTPLPAPAATHIPVDLTPAQRAAVAALARTLNLPPEQINLVTFETVIWPNGCMGVQKMGVICTQNAVPGFWIILSANGKQYEFHTNQDGSVVTPAEGIQTPGRAQSAMIKQLASNLGLQTGDVKVISVATVIWNDSCMGVAIDGTACTQRVVSGYLFLFEAKGRQFEYHTNGDGSRSVPGTIALVWTQGGGSAGACDSLNIYASGEVYGYSCSPKANARMSTLIKLTTADELKQFQVWLDTYQTIMMDFSDPKTTTNGMTRTVNLFGVGNQQPKTEEQKAILDWAQKIFEKLYK